MRTDTNPKSSDNTATRSTASIRRFVDPNDLICPGCGALRTTNVRAVVRRGTERAVLPPGRTALCRTTSGVVAEPVEVIR